MPVWNNPTKVLGKHTAEYNMWRGFMNRCYNNRQKKLNPSYAGCEASYNFQNFDYFVAWLQVQKGFGKSGWQLDKDILVKGNKVYSEDTCCLVPKDVNVLFTYNRKDKGVYPTGVSYKKRLNCYIAQLSVDKRVVHLGCFDTVKEASLAYKKAKETHIKDVANRWKDLLDERVYNALMSWEVTP